MSGGVRLDGAREIRGERREQRCDAGQLCAIGGKRGAGSEGGGERRHRSERTGERESIARRGAAECGAAGDARDILQIGELREYGVGEAFVGGQCGNAIESIIDRRLGGERIAEPVAHQAAAHRRCGGVEDREQAAFACARAQSAFDLERAQGGGVDAEERAAREPFGRRKMRNSPARIAGRVLGGLGLERVTQDRARGADRRFVLAVADGEAEAFQRFHRELRRQRFERVLSAEVPTRACGQREPAGGELGELRMHRAIALLRVHQFARRDAGDLIAKRANRTRQHAERASGNFDGGDVRLGGIEQDRRNPIARATVEQRLVDERSGREYARDRAFNHALRVLRILHLFADRHPMAHRNKPADVALGGVVGHARHRQPFGALSQRDRQQTMGEHGVAVEHLIEVAHPEEENAVGVFGLGTAVLAHRRGGEMRVQRGVNPGHIYAMIG